MTMTLEDHMTTAAHIREAAKHLRAVIRTCELHFNKKGPTMRAVYAMSPMDSRSKISKLKSVLDSEYHKIITKEQFLEHGPIYYKGDGLDSTASNT